MWRALVRSVFSLLLFLGILLGAVLIARIPAAQDMSMHPLVKDPIPDLENKIKDYDADSLRLLYGKNKELPRGYELQALVALSYYPELRDVPIAFELVDFGAALEANFDVKTLFFGRRKYVIYMNISEEGFFSPVHIQHLSPGPCVAIMAHELSHLIYYDQHNTLQLGNWGLRFLTSFNYRAAHEWTSDQAVINRGLGFQLYDYSNFARNAPGIKAVYETSHAFFDEMYMSPSAIVEAMQRTGQYDLSEIDRKDD